MIYLWVYIYYTNLEPREHEFSWWEFGFAYLVPYDQRPDEAKD